MRKIDKTRILSTHYKAREEELERNGQDHPEYNSSNNEHYTDVVMNLLHNQDGLCAYTEMRLCSGELIKEENWVNGKYKNRKPEVFGQLDHFDPTLKDKKGWLWDNFFFIDTDINTKVKGKKDIDRILKPDTDEYDEAELLEYDCEKNIYIPNTSLPEPDRQRISEMIIRLGINFDPVIDRRRRYITEIIKKIELKIEDWDSVEIDEFPTAFKMCRIQKQ